MKGNVKILSISALTLAISSTAFANSPIYVGGSLGYSMLNTPDSQVFSLATPDPSSDTVTQTESEDSRGGMGGSVYVGYDFTQNWALELGYTIYGDSNYKSTQTQTGTNDGTNTAKMDYDTRSYDLFFKGTAPVSSNFSLFGKLGVSYVSQEDDYDNPAGTPTITTDSSQLTTPKTGDETYTAFRPSGALGATYSFNSTVSTSLFFQGFMGQGDFDSDQDAIGSGYLVGLALNVHLG